MLKMSIKKKIAIFLTFTLLLILIPPMPLISHAASADDLLGRWERFGDGADGTIVVVTKQGDTYQATLEKVTGTLVDLGFAVGDLKWKDVVFTSETTYNGNDMFRYEGGGYEYRVSSMKINSSGILEMGVTYNSTDVNVIIGSYQQWKKLSPPDVTKKQIILQIGSPYMTINGIQKEIDPGKGTSPKLVDGRTILPIRAIIEELGGTVGWDGTNSKVTIQLNSNTIELWIGNKTTYINGTSKQTDVAPQIINSRTMIPLRYVIDNLGYDVVWDGNTKKVTINN